MLLIEMMLHVYDLLKFVIAIVLAMDLNAIFLVSFSSILEEQVTAAMDKLVSIMKMQRQRLREAGWPSGLGRWISMRLPGSNPL